MSKSDACKLPAKVTISSFQRFSTKGGVHISVKDVESSTQVLELEMSFDEFARAVTGQGYCHAEAEWRVSKLGLRREHKVETGVTEDNLHEFEIDGWVARQSDLRNHHRYNAKDETYSVTFERFI
ncbi:MAG TPA: hypothetical protein VLA13_08665 [Massilibacterium sp.]|nr:hypothetical protein [Massilibacterium sp.]